MIPGSIFSIISGFMNYSSNKLNSKKLENFKDNEKSKTKLAQVAELSVDTDKCLVSEIPSDVGKGFIIYAISMVLIILFVIYLYMFFWIPWRVNELKRVGRELNKYRILLILGIFFPFINIIISSYDAEEYIVKEIK